MGDVIGLASFPPPPAVLVVVAVREAVAAVLLFGSGVLPPASVVPASVVPASLPTRRAAREAEF